VSGTTPAAEQVGVQVTPWASAEAIVRTGRTLRDQVDTVFLQDQMLARNVYTMLGALAVQGCGVGTNVTWPFGRNPIEMASSAATLSELVPTGRHVTIGIGSGGALAAALVDLSGRAAVVEEAILLMTALWSGDTVELDRFPHLGRRLGYVPGAQATLTYPVPNRPRLLVAGVGPRITRVAAQHADGVIAASNLPMYSGASMRSGLYDELVDNAALRARAASDPAFRMHFGMNVSVAKDRGTARMHARRQAALIVGNPGMWAAMERLDFDMASVHAVKNAIDAGQGVVGAADCVSESLADALIVSGTVDDVVDPLAELRGLAIAHGYTDFFLGGPLGPDHVEAAELLSTGVIPAVWPDRGPR
jgi:alkanesulfonate monooxygenase SsuD/methylene tetrahydromethanopterin reductase-like flavin-dependent oxidoreductase (luciferase family)